MTGDLRPTVRKAVEKFGMADPLFCLAGFSEALWEDYQLRECPRPDWARDVLSQLAYVTPLSIGFYRDETPR